MRPGMKKCGRLGSVMEFPLSSRENWKRRWITVAGRRYKIDFLYHHFTILLGILPLYWRLDPGLVGGFVELYITRRPR